MGVRGEYDTGRHQQRLALGVAKGASTGLEVDRLEMDEEEVVIASCPS
jgi:hypothetical protein